jgi:hypothetical protein
MIQTRLRESANTITAAPMRVVVVIPPVFLVSLIVRSAQRSEAESRAGALKFH